MTEVRDDDIPTAVMPVMIYIRQQRLPRLMRAWLVVLGLSFATVFGIAIWLDPYDAAGEPLTMATHTQLGLEPCGFLVTTQRPCPSCGLTTSFALLLHGDPLNSLRANSVGTLMAVIGLCAVPWCLICAGRGRYLWVDSLERTALWIAGVLLLLLLVRWGIVLATWRPLG